MTDLAELKRMAEKLDDYIAIPLAPPGEIDEEILPAVQATILSLIQRVEEAEAMLKQQDEDISDMMLIAHLNGSADLKNWKTRALKAESDAAFLNELTATPIAILQERSHEEGRLAGIEEAAKVADNRADHYAHFANKHEGSPIGDSNTMRCGAASSIAQAIRALKEKA